jgi:hypothetical protein
MANAAIRGHIVCHAGLVSIGSLRTRYIGAVGLCLGDGNCLKQSFNVHVGFVPASLAARDNRANAILAHVGQSHRRPVLCSGAHSCRPRRVPNHVGHWFLTSRSFTIPGGTSGGPSELLRERLLAPLFIV